MLFFWTCKNISITVTGSVWCEPKRQILNFTDDLLYSDSWVHHQIHHILTLTMTVHHSDSKNVKQRKNDTKERNRKPGGGLCAGKFSFRLSKLLTRKKVSREFLRSRGLVKKKSHCRNTFQNQSILPTVQAAHGNYSNYYAAIPILWGARTSCPAHPLCSHTLEKADINLWIVRTV